MKRYIIPLFSLLGITLLGACSEEDFTSFDGQKSGIFMRRTVSTDINGTPLAYSDSMSVTFASYSDDPEKLRA